MKKNHISIPQKFSLLNHWSEFYLDMYEMLKQFPKRDRHALGIRIESTALSMLDLILLSSKKSAPTKIVILEKIDITFTREKILIRMAHKIKALSDSNYKKLEEKLIVMGKEVGGWLKYEKNSIEKLRLAKQNISNKTSNPATKTPDIIIEKETDSENISSEIYSETEKES